MTKRITWHAPGTGKFPLFGDGAKALIQIAMKMAYTGDIAECDAVQVRVTSRSGEERTLTRRLTVPGWRGVAGVAAMIPDLGEDVHLEVTAGFTADKARARRARVIDEWWSDDTGHWDEDETDIDWTGYKDDE